MHSENSRNNSAKAGLSAWIACCVLAAVATAGAATRRMTTVAGGYLGNGKPAIAAGLANPMGVARDGKGTLYVSDTNNCLIRKISMKGTISSVVGTGICGYSGDDGPARSAMINGPGGLAFDSKGNLLFADVQNSRIRKVTPEGTISTIAGNGAYGYSGDGGPAIQASLAEPLAVSADKLGDIYIADSSNQVIRMVDTAGVIHTVAGNNTVGFSGDGGPAISAQLFEPRGVLADSDGNFYISDSANLRVRKVDSTGTINTYAGVGHAGNGGNGGPATQAGLGPTRGLSLGGNMLYIVAHRNVWAVDLNTQIINIVAGTAKGDVGFNGDGMPATSTSLDYPWGLSFDAGGNLLIADAGNNRIRKVDASQVVTTIAGGYTGDGGLGKAATLNVLDYFGGHIAFDPTGNLYIADTYNNRIRKVTPKGVISTFAGTGITGYTGDGGPASAATLTFPNGVTADASGNVYISDGDGWSGNGVIRKVDSSGTITTLSNTSGAGLAVDSSGNIYAADLYNNVIWKITPAGAAWVVAGQLYQYGYNGDGIPATQAWLWAPEGVAVDKAGNLYIADSDNSRVRKVDTNGIISTVAGNGVFGFGGDGDAAIAAMLSYPTDVGIDTKGNLYVADSYNTRIRVVDSGGTINTLAGTGNFGYNGNGLPATATNVYPSGLSVSPKGIVYVTDIASYRVRKIY
jgi:sugar lactone lactonase YvrE